jgi:hypothetical protein
LELHSRLQPEDSGGIATRADSCFFSILYLMALPERVQTQHQLH